MVSRQGRRLPGLVAAPGEAGSSCLVCENLSRAASLGSPSSSQTQRLPGWCNHPQGHAAGPRAPTEATSAGPPSTLQTHQRALLAKHLGV